MTLSPQRCLNPAQKLSDQACRVIKHQTVGNHLKLLTLKPINSGFTCFPGQFVMLDLPTDVFYLRRPMSVLKVHPDGTFDIYYKIHGVGTTLLAALQVGDNINVLGPLGKMFTKPQSPETALLIGGGIGIAPIAFWGQQLQESTGSAGQCIYGVRSKDELGIETELKATFGQQLHLSTDDGSGGFHGNVCQLLQTKPKLVTQAKEAYICGPTPMMKATCVLLKTLNPAIRIEVSLEEMMPCGTGACSGCVIFRRDQLLPSKTCVEGPVFNVDSIYWPGDEQLKEEQTSADAGASSCPQ